MTFAYVRCGMVFSAAMSICLSVACGSCQARSQMRKAQVTQVGTKPCFSADDSKIPSGSHLDMALISVAEVDGRGAEKKVVWMASTDSRKGVVFSANECIAYASTIPGARVNVSAVELEASKRYEVFINSYVGSGRNRENRRYRASFCLDAESARVRVRQVEWDEEAGRLRWDLCGIPD